MKFRVTLGVVATALLSVAAWVVVRNQHLILTYNDAMSHLNIARRVIDNIQPGLSQVGTVWLPLSHLLYLPFIWSDWAWQSGFAGSVVSMAAYVLATVGVYRIVKRLTAQSLAGLVGALAFALNLNLLYLQATPLTETVYLALLVWSIYCFVAFVQTDDARYLIGLGALGFLQVLTRYDGWFVVCAQAGLMLVYQLRMHRGWREALGRVIIISAPAAFAVALWLLWNASFGSPFYFATGAGSAKAQQDIIEASSSLIAKGHLPLALWLYVRTVMDNVGLQVATLGVAGACYFLLSSHFKASKGWRWTLIGLLVAPVVFNILALFLGFSTIALPEVGNVAEGRNQWFNVRYGIIALPALAIGFGLLARRSRAVAVALVAVVVFQAGVTARDGLIVVKDGTQGASAFIDADVARQLSERVRPGERILMSFSEFSPVSLASGLNLNQYVHEGVQSEWGPSLDDPGRHTQWIVLAKNDIGDPVYEALNKRHHGDFQQIYRLVYSGEHAQLYEAKPEIMAALSARN